MTPEQKAETGTAEAPEVETPEVHQPGVYFGLDEETYHADPSLGSTDVKMLLRSPADYWWHSWMNPLRPERKETKALTRGSALHDLILLGEERFFERYKRKPRLEDYENVLVTSDDIKAVLKEHGLPVSGKKDELITQLEEFEDSYTVWDRVMAKFMESLDGATPLDPDTYDNLMLSGAMINKNPNLRNAFTGGAPEVSVFFERDGVKCKARIDYVKPKANVELKSATNQMRRQFDRAVFRTIADQRYDIQAAHYMHARLLLREFIENGQVYGEPPEGLLDAIMKQDAFTTVWVFYQAEGAPIAKGYIFPLESEDHRTADAEVEEALRMYRDCMERFGTDMWVLDDPLHTITGGDLPPWIGQ